MEPSNLLNRKLRTFSRITGLVSSPASTFLLTALACFTLACAGPTYYPKDEIIETAVSFLEQGQDALIEAESSQAEYNSALAEARGLREGGKTAEAAAKTREAAETRRRAVTQFAFALEQLRLSERINVRPRTYFLLGQAYYDMGDLDQALANFRLGLDMSPNVSIAVRMRDRIVSVRQSVEMGLTPPPENWAPEVEALVAMGPVPEMELAPPIPPEQIRTVVRATPAPTKVPAKAPTVAMVRPSPSAPGEARQAKNVEPTTGPQPPVEDITVRTIATPTPKPTVAAPPKETTPVTAASTPRPGESVSLSSGNSDYDAGLSALEQAREAEGRGAKTQAVEYYNQAVDSLKRAAGDSKLQYTAELHYSLGNAYLGLGDLDNAVAQYTRTVEIDPKHARAYNNMGLAYAQGGHTNSAIEMFEKSAAIGGVPDAHYNAGMLLVKRNDLESALRHLEAYVAVDPSSPYGKEAQRQLIQIRRRM